MYLLPVVASPARSEHISRTRRQMSTILLRDILRFLRSQPRTKTPPFPGPHGPWAGDFCGWRQVEGRRRNKVTVPPGKGGGVLYWNESLSLVWNANLEHSRLGSYWSCYDQLTNSFAAEGLRVLQDAARDMGFSGDVALWRTLRAKVLHGINTALTYTDQVNTGGRSIYAELRGHENRKSRSAMSFRRQLHSDQVLSKRCATTC